MKVETLNSDLTDNRTRDFLSWLGEALRVIAGNRLALLGLIIISITGFAAIFAPVIATHDAYEINIPERLQGPSAEHLLGTDFMGRDTFTRIVYGARTALQVAIGAVLLGACLGIPIGAVAGYSGRAVDAVFMRFMDAMLAFPGRLMAIALVASLGGGLFSLYIA
ncbi:MAG: ABC transporter permease, partial [Candidatus Binatia bacterium]